MSGFYMPKWARAVWAVVTFPLVVAEKIKGAFK